MANKLVKRKNAGKKGNAQLKPKKNKQQDPIAYILTDVKETIVTENFYQPIPMNILKFYHPNVMMRK